jgi:hypothetical protein
MGTAPPELPAPRQESFASVLTGMPSFFIDPASAAKHVFSKWFWIGPAIVMSIVSIIVGLVMSPIIQHVLESQPAPPNVNPEQFQRGITMGILIQRVLMYLTPLFGIALLAIQALILFGISSVLGISTKFRLLFNLVAGCWLIQVLSAIAVLVILKAKGEISTTAELRPPLGLDIFLPEGTNKFLLAFVGYFSIFELWWIVMLVLIFSVAFRTSKAKAAAVVSPLIVIGLLVRLVGAAFQR